MEHLVVVCEEKKAGVGSFRLVGEPGQQRPGGSVYRWWVGSNFIGGGTFCGFCAFCGGFLRVPLRLSFAFFALKLLTLASSESRDNARVNGLTRPAVLLGRLLSSAFVNCLLVPARIQLLNPLRLAQSALIQLRLTSWNSINSAYVG